jgi:hypothetical protein
MTMSGVIGRGWWWLLGKKRNLRRVVVSSDLIKSDTAYRLELAKFLGFRRVRGKPLNFFYKPTDAAIKLGNGGHRWLFAGVGDSTMEAWKEGGDVMRKGCVAGGASKSEALGEAAFIESTNWASHHSKPRDARSWARGVWFGWRRKDSSQATPS